MELPQRKARPTSLVIPQVSLRPRPTSLIIPQSTRTSSVILPQSTSRTRPISLMLPQAPAEQPRRGSTVLDCFMPSTTSTSVPYSPSSTSSSSSSSPGESDVFMEESAFGSFSIDPDMTPESTLNFLTRVRTSSSRSRSSSEESTSKRSSTKSPTKAKISFMRSRATVKKALRKSCPFLNEGSVSHTVSPLYLELIKGIKDDLLHIYRTNRFPPTGLTQFHNKIREILFSGEMAQLEKVWQSEVIPEGTRTLAVHVASPRDGDKLTALIDTWDTLYKNTLPILQALLQPLSHWSVREDVLCGFRDLVLPYAELDVLLTEKGGLNQHHRWRLTQILHILARLGPCTCDLGITTSRDGQRYTRSPMTPSERPVMHVRFKGPRERSLSDDQSQEPASNVVHTGGRFVGSLLQILLQQSGEVWLDQGSNILERLLHLHHGADTQATQHHLKFSIPKESLDNSRSSSTKSFYQLLCSQTTRR